MHILDITAILTTLAAVLSYINHRFVRLPSAIGLMFIALCLSLGLIALGKLGLAGIERTAETFIRSIDFNKTLMQGMLSFLLFAGALHVNLRDLAEQKWVVGTLATVGTVASTFVVGGLFWLLVNGLGLDVPPIYCLVFGALISPTDPIAVLGILKSAGAPKSLEIKITGESLFNDGIGVVLFVVLLELATGGQELSLPHIAVLFAEEAVGGILFGLLLGGIAFWMLSRIDHYSVEVLITLAVVMGGYALALAIHTSGPIAMVVAGLVIGNHGRRFAMSDKTREHLDTFWELIDEILNTVLFVLIGFELLILEFSGRTATVGLLAIPIVLLARLVCVGTPIQLMKLWRTFTPGAVKILTWGGLRGGISVALALSIPAGPERDLILPVTYTVVVFSILVQGLTIGRLIAAETTGANTSPITRD
jgi:CPA1 family monovalent cation:H+ antiporter